MQYDGELLFEDVSFVLGTGDRVGLVGPNGAGKSTLLKLLVGHERPSQGHVERAPGLRIGFFAQQVPDSDLALGDFLRGELGSVARELEAALASSDLDGYAEALDRWELADGWAFEARLDAVKARLGITALPDDRPLGMVSGGEQARVMLAKVLLDDPDVLVLDEPTNHLDAEGSAWLAEFLGGFGGGVLVISHDRAFLDRAVNRIYELDGIHTELQTYEGGYTAYRAEKARRWQRLLLDFEAQEKYRVKLEAEIAAMKARSVEEEAKNPRAPGKRRIARMVARKAVVRQARLARQLQSARWVAEPESRPSLSLAFDASPVGLTGAGLTVEPGERLLISGPNGAGKTTLLRQLAGEDAVLLPQVHDELRTDTTVLEYFRAHVPVYVDEAEALLTGYLFGPDEWGAKLSTLSAGELRRLLLAVMVNTPGKVLLLDEPTNYLDFDILDVVEEALRAYEGTLVMVTHDAYFAEAVGYTRELSLAG
ncbi:ABC-F family ATP-binding cassette domain-containing protein [Longispora albida]|uniref:ABC-F family ATP-binding cassette domain-containing protein n=1 Tax=Longispora albida TaxID=203523 RepID=UPI00036018CB|nr:ABC-F family ATP-binding cassette domain-containing protein [Longispora albida]